MDHPISSDTVDDGAVRRSQRIRPLTQKAEENALQEMRPLGGHDAHCTDIRFVAKTNVKEVMDIPTTEIIRILESDFGDDTKGDMLFLKKRSHYFKGKHPKK